MVNGGLFFGLLNANVRYREAKTEVHGEVGTVVGKGRDVLEVAAGFPDRAFLKMRGPPESK